MSSGNYLHFGAAFASYFLKLGAAYLVCMLLSSLVSSPRKRFGIWLSFMLGSLAWWMYLLSSCFLAAPSSSMAATIPHVSNELFIPTRFQDSVIIAGQLLGCIYIAGVLLLGFVAIWKRLGLHALLEQGSMPSAPLQRLFAAICRSLGVRRCELLIVPGLSSPATVYWWRPRILLPEVYEQVDDEALLADILNHELAHVKRRDYFWSNISSFICQVLFFHPAVWQARKQMRVHREMACDLAVVAERPEHRIDYAHTLTRVARLCLPGRRPAIGVDFAASASLLTDRVRALLNQPEEISLSQKLYRSAACVLVAGAYAFLSAAVGIVLAFAPSGQPKIEAADAIPSHLLSAATQVHRKSHAAPKGEKSLITTPTAYRIQASARGPVYTSSPSISSQQQRSLEPKSGPIAPGTPAPGSSPATTIRSIVIDTVNTVLHGDNDKDDRGARRR